MSELPDGDSKKEVWQLLSRIIRLLYYAENRDFMRTMPSGLGLILKIAIVVLLSIGFSRGVLAQTTPQNTSSENANVLEIPSKPDAHRFCDDKNRVLFSTAVTLSWADFAVTRNTLASGGKELNPLAQPFTGSTAALAGNFVGESAGVIAVSYFLHRTGHHRLERWTPVVSAVGSSFALAYGLAHR